MRSVTFDTLRVDAPIFSKEVFSKNDRAWIRLKEYLLADEEFYWEVRKDNQINVYFEGGNVIRLHYCSRHKCLQAFIHEKYLGINGKKYIDYLEYSKTQDVSLEEIKRHIKEFYSRKKGSDKENWSEKFIQSQYILKYRSRYIDSEFAYKNEDFNLRIDLVECINGKIRFVELKRLDDARMLKETDDSPEVINQINDYRKFIKRYENAIVKYYQKVWDIKNSLNLPNTPIRPNSINTEPHLLIFNRWSKSHPKRVEHVRRMERILDRECVSYHIENEI